MMRKTHMLLLASLAVGCADDVPPASDAAGSTGGSAGPAADSDDSPDPGPGPTPPSETETSGTLDAGDDGSSGADATTGTSDTTAGSSDTETRSTTEASTGTDSTSADETPPELQLLTPRDGAMSATRRIRVTGMATDDIGVDELVLEGVGEPIELAEDGTFTVTVDLAAGANTVAFIARDAANNETDVALHVYFGHRISVGNSQSAFLRDGSLFTWGRNELGQLGNGTLEGSGYGDDPETSALPVRYEIDVDGLVSVVTRQTFMIALRDDGTVMTWGSNSDGQLGYEAETDCGSGGASPCRREPTEVPGITGAVAVAAGFTHSLVLLDDGSVVTFGDNGAGQLGYATEGELGLVPTAVPGLDDIVQVAAGSGCSFALSQDGQVWAWGNNDRGQLGLGTADDEPHVVPALVPDLSDVASVAAANTTTYALLHDSTMMSWGRNHAGQAGVGADTSAEILAPTPMIAAGATPPGDPFVDVVAIAGDGFVGLGLTAEAGVFAWGLGSLGQLGQGYLSGGERDLDNRWVASPVAVEPADAALFDIVEIEAGAGGPSLALSADGHLFGWGWSFRGSLGLEGAIDAWAYSAPVLVFAAD